MNVRIEKAQRSKELADRVYIDMHCPFLIKTGTIGPLEQRTENNKPETHVGA